ncbi:hypothetical protein [Streptomyces sp. NPDC056464]|uniref:hypothetical protein n=1 Tax=Streptomyces sp. NPDC056464 TaxID=3345828 RepID=UPI0036AF91FC
MQTNAVLLTHGVEVEARSAQGVAAHLVETMARQVNMDLEESTWSPRNTFLSSS